MTHEAEGTLSYNSLEHLVATPGETIKTRTLYNPIEYFGAITSRDGAPYDFRINESKFAEYLRKEFGFTSADFEKLRVYVIGQRPFKGPNRLTKEQGEFFFDPEIYDPKKSWAGFKEDEEKDGGAQHITFYAFNFWRDLNREREAIIRFARIKRRTEKSWETFDKKTELLEKNKKHPKLGKRFTEFLAKVVPDDIYQLNVTVRHKRGLKPDKIPLSRAIPIINRFVYNLRAKNAFKDHIIIHETSHAFQYKVSWNKLKKLTARLTQFFLEIQAESEEVRMAKKPEWFGMVDFRVNEPQNVETIARSPRAA